MSRITATFQVSDTDHFKKQMLNWANRFNIFLFLDSHSYSDAYSRYEWLLAADAVQSLRYSGNGLDALKNFLQQQQHDWLFGHCSYDLKNDIEALQSAHPDHIGFPELHFFQPAVVIKPSKDGIHISSIDQEPAAIMAAILETTATPAEHHVPTVSARINRADYIRIIEQLRQHIQQGDCYEINFCMEFFAENAVVDPLLLYQKLSAVSPTPFGGFYKLDQRYLLCASPERFLQKTGNRIISQPIKGTIRRNQEDAAADEALKQQLQRSQKDRSENVMVVDLVRNDLSRICSKGSVVVEELCGLYSFPQVHQLISTIAGELPAGTDLADILRATFPMGSMTGAPKYRVMQLTEQYEKTKRGIYSGCIGYISPDGDFDFNVVIRSIMYQQEQRYLAYQVGGGITIYSNPEQEYEECLLKASAIKKVLQ